MKGNGALPNCPSSALNRRPHKNGGPVMRSSYDCWSSPLDICEDGSHCIVFASTSMGRLASFKSLNQGASKHSARTEPWIDLTNAFEFMQRGIAQFPFV